MTPYVTEARHRLEVLAADTVTEQQREARRLQVAERSALLILLIETHRLHGVVSQQESTIRSQKLRLAAAQKPKGKKP